MVKEQEYINLRTLSTRIGLSPRTIRTWIIDSTTPLPYYKVGGKLLFCWKDVIDWLEKFRVERFDVENVVNEIMDDLERNKK